MAIHGDSVILQSDMKIEHKLTQQLNKPQNKGYTEIFLYSLILYQNTNKSVIWCNSGRFWAIVQQNIKC